MRVSPLCPFCNSQQIDTTSETELLVHQQCGNCGKRWAAANVPERAYDAIARSADEQDGGRSGA